MNYKSNNPALTNSTFDEVAGDGTAMTLNGVIGKSLLMLLVAIATGVGGWRTVESNPNIAGTLLIGLIVVTLAMAVFIVFKKKTARFLALPYAALEGVVLGVVSAYYESLYSGIVLQAILATASVFIVLLAVYRSGLIKVSDNFKLGVAAATGGIFLFYLLSFGLSFFGVDVPLVNDSGVFGVLFSLFVIVIASLNLVIDFDFIEKGVENKSPKHMEWYASFGLFITLVWLYFEMLRLIRKLRSQ